ncbi:head GIN domain-containing protein [Lishizhenia sp.]|uniref:head GIN domain-containing protein n=1 Tax=Lishizhenia sp. TaxID=2497594 RepID=UPI00299DF36A|nr:head GIN domain-containing protein [Lishizhenia sp.]MDX1444546.1 head GIN domain-containing protein [Lishizhenia sp.]
MKRYLFLITLVGLVVSSCSKFKINPSSTVTTEDKGITGFTKLKLRDNINAYVTFSSENEGVIIEANENIHDRIVVSMVSGELEIDIKPNTRFRNGAVINTYITVPYLSRVSAHDASSLTFENRLETDHLEAIVTDASHFYGELNVDDAFMKVRDASHIDLAGTCNTLELICEDASSFEDYSFEVEHLDVFLRDASNAKITVNQTLRVTAKDASSLKYKGNPTVDHIDISDASSVTKM